MVEYKIDRSCDGYDVFFDGRPVGWVSFGDLRQLPDDRRPVTMLRMDKGTKYHASLSAAKEYIETVYKREVTA